ncbi:hypothetical protein K466DRAFT_488631, partial [Polyporus arcularius HHB13444]
RRSLLARSRIDTFARYSRPRKAIYSLGYVPVDATWGSGVDARTLTVAAGRITIWVIGTLERLVYTVDHTAPSSLSVAVSLLRECDRARMINLLRRTAPKSSELMIDTLISEADCIRAEVFRSIYDASVKYEETSFMKRMCVTDLCPGDYVLVETMLVRKLNPADGHAWTVNFELCSLSLLNGAPRAALLQRETGFRGEM